MREYGERERERERERRHKFSEYLSKVIMIHITKMSPICK